MSAPTTAGPTKADLNYGLDEVPKPWPKALGLGLQHVLTMFGATIAVPFILAPILEFNAQQLAILISATFIACGAATIVQVQFGSRLPIVQGVSFAFLGPFIAVASTYQGELAMRYIAGAIMAGAVVEMIIGFGGVIGLLRRFITPVTIAPVIALIGLALYDAAAINAAPNWWLALATLAVIVTFSLILAPKVRMFSLFPILLAVVSMYLVASLLTVFGVFNAGEAGHVSFAAMGDTPWIRGIVPGEGGVFFPWGGPLFDVGIIVAVLAAYLASAIESFGDYHAISRIAGVGDPSTKTINRGIGAEGVGCFLAGIFGGFSATSYSENIGLVGLTKVASRVVVIIGGAALIVLGLASKIGAVIATIPGPIVGGVYLALFGLIASIGLSNLRRVDMDSQRNLMIIGIVLFMGFVVPRYFAAYAGDDWNLWNIEWLSDVVRSIGSNAIAVGALTGLLLDNVVPGTDEERGLHAPVILPPADASGLQEDTTV
jgi:solute carrier family 23 (nucleobase transporter), member 1